MKKAPFILQRHKRARIQFAENQLNTNWNYASNLFKIEMSLFSNKKIVKVIFSDEKSGALMVAMATIIIGEICAKVRSIFQNEISVWGAFTASGTLEIQFTSTKI